MKYLKLLLLLCFVVPAFGQDDYDKEFLIPFNDHGKWGWSDTLGVLASTPKFDSTGFFFESESFYFAKVRNGKIATDYIYGYGLASPADHSAGYLFESILLNNHFSIIKDLQGNYGLFDFKNQKVIVPSDYANYAVDYVAGGFVVFSNEGEKVMQYSIKTRKFKSIPFQSISEFHGEGVDIIYDKGDGKSYIRTEKGGFEEVMLPDENSGVTREGFYDENRSNYQPLSKWDIGRPAEGVVYSTVDLGKNRKFEVIRNKGKFGLYDSHLKEYLPCAYDFIDIDYVNGAFYLFRDGKMGVKLVGTHYPTIEPEFDFITYYKSLPVSSRWSFWLFEATINGHKAFVGENGVKYYRFD